MKESEFAVEVVQKEKLLTQSQNTLDRLSADDRDIRAVQAFIYLEKAKSAKLRDYEEAMRLGHLGLTLYRDLNDRLGEGEILGFLGTVYTLSGAYDRAGDLMRDSLEIKQGVGDTDGIARGSQILGQIARHQGDFEAAEALLRNSLYLFQQLGNRRSERICLSNLSYTLSFAGKFSAAKRTAGRAVELDRELGQYPNPTSLNSFSMAAIHLGHNDDELALVRESLEAAKQRGALLATSLGYLFLGKTSLIGGEHNAAKRYLLESLANMMELKHIYRAIVRAVLSYVLRAQGENELASGYLKDALQLGIEYHSITPITYCLPIAALLVADDGNQKIAVELYGKAQQFGHIANSHWFEKVACRELDSLMASMPPETATAAYARGGELDMWLTAEELLIELDA